MLTIDYDKYEIKFLKNLPRHEPSVMDSTAAKLLMDCRRKYFYRIVLGRKPLKDKFPVILQWGTHYHKFRELLETVGYLKAMEYALQVKLPDVDPNTKFGFLDHRRFVLTCQKAYERWQDEKAKGKIEVLAVEQFFTVELFEDYFIAGRWDQVIKWMGKIWIRDWKTTTKDKATFERQIEPNDQAIRYIVAGGKVHGRDIEGVVFEAAYNAKEPAKKTTLNMNSKYTEIYSVNTSRNTIQKDNWIREEELRSRQLKVYRQEDIWPMDATKCDWCEYHNVCKSSSEPTMEAKLKQDFKLSPWDCSNTEQVDLE